MRGERIAAAPGKGAAAGEDGANHSARLRGREGADPIRRLLDLLESALATGGPIYLPNWRTVRVRPVTDYCYAVNRRP